LLPSPLDFSICNCFSPEDPRRVYAIFPQGHPPSGSRGQFVVPFWRFGWLFSSPEYTSSELPFSVILLFRSRHLLWAHLFFKNRFPAAPYAPPPIQGISREGNCDPLASFNALAEGRPRALSFVDVPSTGLHPKTTSLLWFQPMSRFSLLILFSKGFSVVPTSPPLPNQRRSSFRFRPFFASDN